MDANAGQTSKSRKFGLTYNALTQAAGLIIVYVILLFVLPVGHETVGSYRPGPIEYKLLRFSVTLPSLLVWLAAFAGYATLKQYARLLQSAPEGKHYARLANGCTWLAWSLPISSLVSLISSSIFYVWPPFHAASIIITNYTELALPLVAFTIIGAASSRLVSGADIRLRLASTRLIILVFLAAGILYCYLTISHFNLHNLNSTANPYHLPIWLMVITVIIPYLYTWFVGLLATYEITLFSRHTQGLLYRRALKWLVTGLVTIITSSMALQYLNGVEPRTGHLLLNYRLFITVLFRVTSGIGFILLSIGALKLKKIEEV